MLCAQLASPIAIVQQGLGFCFCGNGTSGLLTAQGHHGHSFNTAIGVCKLVQFPYIERTVNRLLTALFTSFVSFCSMHKA